MEKIKPSYSKSVTIGCLNGLIELHKTGHLNRHEELTERMSSHENALSLFFAYIKNESFSPVRRAAADCIVEYLIEKWNWKEEVNLFRLIDFVTDGDDATLRYHICRSLLKKITFFNDERTSAGVSQILSSEKLFNKLWSCFVSTSCFDLSVHCTLLDVCFFIFGKGTPSFTAEGYRVGGSSNWKETGVYGGAPMDTLEQPIVLDDSFTESI